MTREEAISIVRNIYQTDSEKEALGTLIPELKESEDERIRNEILVYIGAKKDIGLETHNRWCSYLEKQKEEIPYTDFVIKPHKGDDNNPYDMRASEAQEYAVNRGFGIPFIDGEVYVDERHMIQTIGNIIRWADEHPKEQKPRKFKLGDKVHWYDNDTNVITITGFRDDAYLTDSAYGPILFCDEDNWEKIEQKPAEWSPTKEQMVALSWAANGMLDNDSPSAGDIKAELRSLHNDLQSKSIKSGEWDNLQLEFRNINEAFEDGKKEVLAHPEKYGLCKPAECKATINGEPIPTENQSVDIPLAKWSDEDEDFIDMLILHFNYLIDKGGESVETYKSYIKKLKSLRPQPKKELSIEKAIQWLDDTFYFLDKSSGRGRDCEITTHDFDSLEEMYDSFRKAVMVDSKHHWKPTKTDVALFNKAVTTNKALTPAERAQLDIIRSKFGCCRAVNCDGIVQEEQCDENEVRLEEIIDLIGYSPISEKLKNEYVSFLKSLSCKSASSKWIPATNPPEKSELVITCSNDNGTPQCIGLSKYVNGKWYDLMGDEDEGYFNVDYWMPIPMF